MVIFHRRRLHLKTVLGCARASRRRNELPRDGFPCVSANQITLTAAAHYNVNSAPLCGCDFGHPRDRTASESDVPYPSINSRAESDELTSFLGERQGKPTTPQLCSINSMDFSLKNKFSLLDEATQNKIVHLGRLTLEVDSCETKRIEHFDQRGMNEKIG